MSFKRGTTVVAIGKHLNFVQLMTEIFCNAILHCWMVGSHFLIDHTSFVPSLRPGVWEPGNEAKAMLVWGSLRLIPITASS